MQSKQTKMCSILHTVQCTVQCTVSQTSLCPDSLKEDESEAKIEQPSQQKRSCQDFLNQGETDRDK